MSDLHGSSNLQRLYFIVRPGNATANACYVRFDLETGKLRLAADSGQAWVDRPPILTTFNQHVGMPYSQCTVETVRVNQADLAPSGMSKAMVLPFVSRYSSRFRGMKRSVCGGHGRLPFAVAAVDELSDSVRDWEDCLHGSGAGGVDGV